MLPGLVTRTIIPNHRKIIYNFYIFLKDLTDPPAATTTRKTKPKSTRNVKKRVCANSATSSRKRTPKELTSSLTKQQGAKSTKKTTVDEVKKQNSNNGSQKTTKRTIPHCQYSGTKNQVLNHIVKDKQSNKRKFPSNKAKDGPRKPSKRNRTDKNSKQVEMEVPSGSIKMEDVKQEQADIIEQEQVDFIEVAVDPVEPESFQSTEKAIADVNEIDLSYTYSAPRFSCDKCSYVARNSGALTMHKESWHGKQVHYPCNLCNFVSPYDSCLKAHKKTAHQVYCCLKCDYSSSQSELTYHKMYRHKGLRHECDECEYATKNPNELILHKENRHARPRETIENPFYIASAQIKREEIETGW